MSDIGIEALERIHKALLIDDEWTEWGSRSFEWIGHRLKQRLNASPVFDDGDFHLSRLTAETVVVDEVSAPEDRVAAVLSDLNQHALGNAYSYRREERRIVATAVTVVHADTLDWRSTQFEAYAIAQIAVGEAEADYLAARTGGQVAVRSHPTIGKRQEPDDMLNVVEDLYATDGRLSSRFESAFEFETMGDVARGSPRVATLGGSATGIALEVAFAHGTSLTMFATDVRHRRIGNGLSVRLSLPMTVGQEDGERIATFLNDREANGESDALHYGAWYCANRQDCGATITYGLFFPNRLYRLGVAQDAGYAIVRRALWADRILNGQTSSASAWDVMVRRVREFWRIK